MRNRVSERGVTTVRPNTSCKNLLDKRATRSEYRYKRRIRETESGRATTLLWMTHGKCHRAYAPSGPSKPRSV